MAKKKKKRSRGLQPSRADKKTAYAAVFASLAQAVYFIVKTIKELKS